MKNNGIVRLSLKTAKALIKQEFGMSGAALTTERAGNDVYIYKMQLGRFEVTVSNDWFEQNGLLKISISTHTGGFIDVFYNPSTLEEDFDAHEKQLNEIRQEQCACCSLMETAKAANDECPSCPANYCETCLPGDCIHNTGRK